MAAIDSYSAMSALDGTEKFLGVQTTAKLATGQQLMTLITGSTTLSGATVTTSQPLINMTQTWNDAAVTFTGLKLNVTSTASSSASLLIDLQLAGASKFSVNRGGNTLTLDAGTLRYGYNFAAAWELESDLYLNAATRCLRLRSTGMVTFGATIQSPTVGLGWNATDVLEINSSTAGTFRDLKLRNVLTAGGNGSYVQTPSMTVANLAAAATAGAGARAFVTDANTTHILGIGTTVVGGGANKVPVYSDGAGWLIG